MLSAAVLLGDHEMASWVDLVVKRHQVTGTPEQLLELSEAAGRRDGAAAGRVPDRKPDPEPLIHDHGDPSP